MRAGILFEEIQILKLQVERNEFGEQFDLYCPCCKTRAEVVPASGSRTEESNEVFYAHTYRFTIRRYINVDDFDRIMWKGKQYRILNIDDDRVMNQKVILAELINL